MTIENTVEFIIYKAFFIQFQVSARPPLVLLIPVSTSGTLATQRETESTGSTPRGTETLYQFTATWLLMAVSSVESNSLNKCLDPLNACVKDKFLPQRSSKIPG